MNELQKEYQPVELTRDVVKKYICPSATEQEIFLFLQMCHSQGLNPFLREAYLIKYGEEKASMVVGKETFTKRADKLPDCDGMEAGIIVLDNAKVVTYRNGAFIVAGEELLGGWANVYRKGRSHPYRIEVSLKEYERRNKKGELTKAWREMPATMLRKVALVQALREAYPQEFANMLSPEEMPVDALPDYKMGQDILPPTIPMPQRRSEAAATSDDNPFEEVKADTTVTITNVATKSGEKNGKKWHKHTITASNGIIYSTFSDTFGQVATKAMESHAEVKIDGVEGQYGWEMKSIEIIPPFSTADPVWNTQEIISIISSSDSVDVLNANWKSLLPHIGKLDSEGKSECQKAYNVVKECMTAGPNE